MSDRLLGRRRHRVAALIGISGLALGGLAIATPAGAAPPAPTATYLVQLSDVPAAGYTGGVAGYTGTKPAVGAKLDKNSAAVTRYRTYLRSRHDAVLGKVKSAQKVYDYSVTFNGFAARMTAGDASLVARTAGVRAVIKDEKRKLDTTSTPAFLGLSKPGGLWSKLGGPGPRGAGSGVVVGVVDSGIWPESPSFAPLASPKPVHGWQGICQTGEQWTLDDCSTKIIGARYYTEGYGGPDRIKQLFPFEYVSPRDADGHGSHTSSTAAGDYGVDVVVDGNNLGKASGMAPNARIAMYKVCWGADEGACFTSDSVQAIEDATADGVDVINFSISGSLTSVVDPVESAFLNAADAGVFVAASAGNSGPGASTVAHNDPWVTTVAAGTHDRAYRATVTLGNGASYTGAGLGAAVPTSPIVLSTQVGLAGADPTQVRLCFPGTLDPTKVTGKIVVCDRGVNARTDKSLAVQQAGGVGMVLVNTSPNSLNADLHYVPTVHVDQTAGAAIKAYVAATPNATASLSQGQLVQGAQAPFVASFSSRGPALAGGGDLLKPDIMAPGVDVLAAVSPPGHNGRSFDFLSGTSMASPHIAGIGALLRQAHPRWSPMAIKSALLTTAAVRDNTGQPIKNDSGTTATALDYGSGQVTPNSAVDPGLVYDSGLRDWIRFLCGAGQFEPAGQACRTFGSIDPSNLNTPNIAIGSLAGVQTVTRTVTNVGKRTATYVAFVNEPAGLDIRVTPSRIRLAPGRSKTFTVKITRVSGSYDEYAFGALTWSDGRHRVRSQIVVKPVGVAAPAEVYGTGTSGSVQVPLTAGFTGTLTTSVAGLVPATVSTGTLTNPTGAGFDPSNPQPSEHTLKATISVPAGTTLARFNTFDRDYPAGTDLDLFVFEAGTANLVGSSTGGTAEEQVDLVDPPAGDYDVYVDLFGLAPGQTSVEAMLFSWVLGTTAAGNLTVSPASQPVTTGGSASVTVSWSGLTAGQRYLGRVVFGENGTPRASTLVRVDA